MSKLSVLTAIASVMILSACGQSGDAAQADAAASAKTGATVPGECKDHPLLVAMPEPAALGGKPLTSMNCQPFSIEMIWGEAGSSTSIILVDSQGPIGNLPAAMADMGRKLPFQATKSAVLMTEGVRQMAEAYPASMDELGGPDFLPVVKEAAGGLKYALEVEAKDAGGLAGSVVGIAKDRYALTINIEQDTVVGVAAGEAAYAPWLSAMRMTQLP